MTHSYNKAKKSRRKSKPKHGHRLGKGEHSRRGETNETQGLVDSTSSRQAI